MPGATPAVSFQDVVKTYAGGEHAVNGVTLDVPRGTFAVLVGPSGSGKTTLLKTVNRLYEPTSGRVFVDGVDVATTDPVALRRRIGYVIQQVGLFPHMTVATNIGIVPSLLGWDSARIAVRVDELLTMVHLEPDRFRDRYPDALSGGQAQRVGLARALAADPDILLMDEPFGALDAIERERLQGEMADLHSRLHKTVLFVTHDVNEALRLADLLVVMRAGKIEQAASPLDVITGPANAFVASLLDADDVMRRFSLMRVGSYTSSEVATAPAGGFKIGVDRDLRTALAVMMQAGVESLRVIDAKGATVGTLTLADLQRAARPATAAR